MTVSIADNVNQNLDSAEKIHVESFCENPGWNGQRLKVKIGYSIETCAHTTYGAGSGHASIFYKRDGENYNIIGVGKHSGTKGGHTTYEALWNGRDSSRVTVTVMGTK